MRITGGAAAFWLPDDPLAEDPGQVPETLEDLRAILEHATDLLKKALKLDPDLHRARFDLAVAYMRMEETAECVTWAERYHSAQPDDQRGVALLATAYLAAERWDDLAKFCEEALRGEAENEEYLTELTALAWWRKGDLDAAAKWASAAIRANPQSLLPYYIRAAIQHSAGDGTGLEETLRTIRQLDPKAEETMPRMLKWLEKGSFDGSP